MALNKALRLNGSSPDEEQDPQPQSDTHDNGLPTLASMPSPKMPGESGYGGTGTPAKAADFPDPTQSSPEPGGITGGTQATPQASPSSAPTSTPAGQASGYTPQNPDAWKGIDPRLTQLYQEHGVMTPGAAGSGFKDANYWNTTAMQNAGGDFNYIKGRLSADLEGRGTDTPGSGDVGNMSRDPNAGRTMGVSQFGSGPMSDAIQRLLARGESPDLQSPAMQQASSAHRAALDRSVRNQRSALAERSAASGLNLGGSGSGSFDSAVQSGIEGAGIDQANFDSGMQLDEIKQRREDVVNALQFAQGEERNQLQLQLAQMNDQLQRAQMGQQNSQFYDQFSNNRDQFDQTYNLDYLKWLASQGSTA